MHTDVLSRCAHCALSNLQADGCYVPLDPDFPADRLSIYLEDSQSLAVVTEHKHLELAASLTADLPCQPKVSPACDLEIGTV